MAPDLDDDELLWEAVDVIDESAAPTHFVFGKRGAIVREGPQLDSAVLRELASLTEVIVVEHVRARRRMRPPPAAIHASLACSAQWERVFRGVASARRSKAG